MSSTGVGKIKNEATTKIDNTSSALSKWNNDNFGNISTQIKELEEELARVQAAFTQEEQPISIKKQNEAKVLKKRSEFLLSYEHILWAQNAR